MSEVTGQINWPDGVTNWWQRFSQLALGETTPTIAGWTALGAEHGPASPSWVDYQFCEQAWWLFHKGSKWRIHDEAGELVMPGSPATLAMEHRRGAWPDPPPPLTGSLDLVSLHHWVNHSFDWWDFGDLLRYYSPWTHPAPRGRQQTLSAGQYYYTKTGDLSLLYAESSMPTARAS